MTRPPSTIGSASTPRPVRKPSLKPAALSAGVRVTGARARSASGRSACRVATWSASTHVAAGLPAGPPSSVSQAPASSPSTSRAMTLPSATIEPAAACAERGRAPDGDPALASSTRRGAAAVEVGTSCVGARPRPARPIGGPPSSSTRPGRRPRSRSAGVAVVGSRAGHRPGGPARPPAHVGEPAPSASSRVVASLVAVRPSADPGADTSTVSGHQVEDRVRGRDLERQRLAGWPASLTTRPPRRRPRRRRVLLFRAASIRPST